MQPMTAMQAVAEELAYESTLTREVLSRIPEDKFDYKPHPKSMPMIGIASHIAECFDWTEAMVNMDVFDLDMENYTPWAASSSAELLAKFDENLTKSLDLLRGCPDEKAFATWKMTVNGQPAMELPRIAVCKSMLVNHIVHHRAQIGVYLRLNDIPVPAIYGPSADDPGSFGG